MNHPEANSRRFLAKFDALFGFLLPIPIFLQVEGGFRLYSDAFESTGLSLPLAYFLLPIAILIGVVHGVKQPILQPAHLALVFALPIWWGLLALRTAFQNPTSLLYAAQWAAPLFIILYAASLMRNPERLERFLNLFTWGTLLSLLYLLALAAYEFLFLDSFHGRMTQNAVLPGTYQLYNYVPEGLVISGIFCAFLGAYRGEKPLGRPLLFLALCLLVPLVTGSRGPLLVSILCTVYFAYRFFPMHGFLAAATLAPILLVTALQFLPGDDFLLLEKVSSIGVSDEFGGLSGNRDVMAGLYWTVFQQEPLTGTGMLPPSLAFPELGIEVKSAHNYYIDSLAWGGPLSLLGVLLLLGFTIAEVMFRVILPVAEKENKRVSVFWAAVPPALAMMMVSSLLRVPLREPYSGPIGFLLVGLVLAGGYQLRGRSALRDA